jgi:hypothetical protein
MTGMMRDCILYVAMARTVEYICERMNALFGVTVEHRKNESIGRAFRFREICDVFEGD